MPAEPSRHGGTSTTSCSRSAPAASGPAAGARRGAAPEGLGPRCRSTSAARIANTRSATSDVAVRRAAGGRGRCARAAAAASESGPQELKARIPTRPAAPRSPSSPTWARRCAGNLVARSMFGNTRMFNLTITNVPGPQQRLYAFGAPLVEVLPLVPLFAGHTIGIAVVTYAGHMVFGLNADRMACARHRRARGRHRALVRRAALPRHRPAQTAGHAGRRFVTSGPYESWAAQPKNR